MSDEIKQEIEAQITGTRLSIMKEIKTHIKMFYFSVLGMIFCLFLGFYIGTSQNDSTSKMVYHTQKKIDLLLDKFEIKYRSK